MSDSDKPSLMNEIIREAEAGDKGAQHFIDAIGIMCVLLILGGVGAFIFLVVMTIIHFVNGGTVNDPYLRL